jgi:hypothetical protein
LGWRQSSHKGLILKTNALVGDPVEDWWFDPMAEGFEVGGSFSRGVFASIVWSPLGPFFATDSLCKINQIGRRCRWARAPMA